MKKRKVVSLVALICACMLLAHLTAAGPPQTARLTDTTVVVMEGPSNVEAIGITRNTESGTQVSEKPKLVMTNLGKMVPWVQGAPAIAPASGSRGIGFDGTPGTGAPPALLGGFPMTAFPDNPNPLGTVVTTAAVPSPPCDGVITFDPAMQLQAIGSGWNTWSHGYTGQVYVPEAYASITTLLITMPDNTCAFYLYVEPNSYSTYWIECIANEGLADEVTSGDVMVTGDSGATYFGFFSDSTSHIQTVRVNADPAALGFAVGEFGIACGEECVTEPVACCIEATGVCTEGVEIVACMEQGGRFEVGINDCDLLDPPCGQMIGACCVGPAGEPPYDPYECIGDMTNAVCLAAGEETFWTAGESCEASPPFDCGAPTYCDGSGGCDEYISSVYLPHAGGTIDNPSACTGYGDYTDQVALMLYSMSYDITVTNGNYYSSDVTAVWVDWNGDKDWDDDGERVMNVDPGGAVASGSFSVPPTAIPGYTRMRIRIDYANPTPSPCGTTTYGEVEDYTVLISGEVPFGACCDPTIGVCTDDVEATDCLPPKQFAMEQLCEDAFPNCGDRGACCYDLTEEGDCVEDVLALDCDGTRHAPGGTCADFDPPCGELDFIFVFDPGTGPPPGVQCGCPMTALPLDPRPTLTDVNDVPSPCLIPGDIEFSTPLSHRRIGDGWMSWSHDYTGDVYYTNGATEVTLTLPPGSCGLYFYVEPNPFELHSFRLTVNGAIVSEEFTAHGSAGAAYAGVCGDGLETVKIECTTGVDFAIGEFGMCCFCEPAYGSCCDPATGSCADGIEVHDCLPPLQFGYETLCSELYPPCGNPGACCNIYTGECEDNVLELDCPAGSRFEGGEQCAEMEPECGTPGACCDDSTAECTIEFQANCPGRFIAGAACEPDPWEELGQPACGEWECSGILYAPSEPDNAAFRAKVAALTGQPCDYWDTSASIPTLADLQDYCCVFTWVDYAYADAVGFGNVLAQFADMNGKVILGQWTYHTTQVNWMEGEIMEPEYCPVTCTSYGYDSYVDGSGTDCIFCNVHELYGDYFDQCTVVPGAMEDGLLAGGKLAAGWRTDRRVYYQPGNTGGTYTYTTDDMAQIIANICACTGPEALGACCDPTTGICTDDVDCADCLPPLEFSIAKACADLDPPCGDPGCCCYPEDGENPLEPYEALAANCDGRFLSGVLGDDCVGTAFDPECGLYAACQHSITMWDSYGDGWNGCTIDVYVNGDLVLAGATIASGAGPETVYFPAGTGATIFVDFTCVSWCSEPSYCVYDGFGLELGCATGGSGAGEGDLTVTGNCEPPMGGCCLGTDGCQVITGDECTAAGGTYLGNFTDCGDMADCDGDGMTDLCAIVAGAEDCDGNGIPDSCELAGNDCQPDGILDACQLYTRPVCCGDGYCVEGEDCEWCPEDCGECPYCGDGICQPEAGEDCETCEEDCGPCLPSVSILIFTDSYPSETTWELVEQGGGVVASGGPLSSGATLYTWEVNVDPEGCYDFTIFDAYGDGICCAYGYGWYEVWYEDVLVGSGGEFGSSETVPDIGGGCGGGGGSGDCCWDHYPETGCEDPVCEASVCSYDSYCCDYGWDGICADEAATDPNCDCSGRGARGGVRDNGALISQLPNQSNGIFSDCDCDYCGQPQVLAENFILAEDNAIGTVRFWGGMYPSDHDPANSWHIAFYQNSAGVPGAEIASYTLAGTMVETGIVLFGVHEVDVSVTLTPPLALAAGTYHVAVYADSVGDSDSWFWEVGNFDSAAGIMGQAYGFTCPPTFPYYDSATDMAFELYAGAVGPPINDCNENGVPDECDLDCNNNCIPDDCEAGPVTCGDLDLKPGSCPNSFNRDSHGVLPVALMGAEFFDLSKVDISSIRLSRPGEAGACEHSITMWDSYGNGWNGCTIDVYVNGEMVLEDVAIGYGSGPETVYFEAETGDTIFVDFTCVSWCSEPSYCVYDGEGTELGCATGGYNPGDGDLTVTGNCPGAGLIGSVAPHEGPPGPHTQFADVATPFDEGVQCECHDLNGDGIDDISMKFKTDEVVQGLELNDLPSGALVPVVITGYTIGGSPFTSPTDCLRLVPPGTSSHMLTVESNKAQVPIEASPLDDTLDGGGFANFTRSYPETTVVTLTAEAHAPDGKPFVQWLIDGVPQSKGVLTIEVVVDDETTVKAVYNLTALVPRLPVQKPPGHQLVEPGVPAVPELPEL